MKKRLLCILLAATFMLLAGCTNNVATTAEITEYVQWTLDAQYLGEFPEEYLTEFNTDVETETGYYLEGIELEAEYVINMYYLEDLTDEEYDLIVELYKQLYSHSSYTVGEATAIKDKENTYAVPVSVAPIDFFEKVDAVLETEVPAMEDEFYSEYEDSDLSEEELYAVYNAMYNEVFLAAFEAQLQEPIVYEEAVDFMITVEVEEIDDTYVFGISDTDFQQIDTYMIDYNM